MDRYVEENYQWNRSRNLNTAYLLEEGVKVLNAKRVTDNVNLWWEYTIKYKWGNIYFDWDYNYNIHLLNEKNERIKKPTGENEYYHFSAIGKDYKSLKQSIKEMYQEWWHSS